MLLDTVHLYRIYRWLDTLPLYLYYELLVIIIPEYLQCLVIGASPTLAEVCHGFVRHVYGL